MNRPRTSCDFQSNAPADPSTPGANLISEAERAALTDELLAIRCQLGEPAAFDELVERWNGPLWRYVRRMVDDDHDAADTLQEVWIRILRGLPSLREPGRLRPWLFGIARRALVDRLRRAYARPKSLQPPPEDTPTPEVDRDLIDDLGEVRDELSAMPIVEREVLMLFYLEELPLAQIAEVLAIPEGTVKSRLFRARKMLRDRLERKGSEQ